jgi:CheY-like chemotaxis protein
LEQLKRVLVVDDEDIIRATVAEALVDEGYQVVTAAMALRPWTLSGGTVRTSSSWT